MAKYSVVFRLAASKRRVTRNVLTERDEPDAAKVLNDVAGVLAEEFRVKPEHVVLLSVTPQGLAGAKAWTRPADAPKPAGDVVPDDDYTGPTRKQIAEMRKVDLIDLILAKGLEIDTDGNVEAVRAAVSKALKPPR